MPSLPSPLLPTLLALLALTALLEVGFIGSMVSYLHIAHHDIPFQISATGSTPQFALYPKPVHMSVNQGHTSNGAAGTALILVSILGYLVLWQQKRAAQLAASSRHSATYTHVRSSSDGRGNTHTRKERQLPRNFSWLEPTWVVFTVLSWLLTLSALIYTFVVTKQTEGSHIDLTVAAATYTSRNGTTKLFPYPGDKWTPETWYKEVLRLGFVDASEKGDIRTHVHLMEGWRWNLIPLFLLGAMVMGVAVLGWVERRRRGDAAPAGRRSVREKHVSTVSEL